MKKKHFEVEVQSCSTGDWHVIWASFASSSVLKLSKKKYARKIAKRRRKLGWRKIRIVKITRKSVEDIE